MTSQCYLRLFIYCERMLLSEHVEREHFNFIMQMFVSAYISIKGFIHSQKLSPIEIYITQSICIRQLLLMQTIRKSNTIIIIYIFPNTNLQPQANKNSEGLLKFYFKSFKNCIILVIIDFVKDYQSTAESVLLRFKIIKLLEFFY